MCIINLSSRITARTDIKHELSYLRYLCLFAHSGVEHIFCCCFLFVMIFSLILDYCLSLRSGILCTTWGIIGKSEAINILFYLHYYEANISSSYKISVILNL